VTVGGRWPGEQVGFSDPEIDELLVKMAQEVEFERRYALAQEFQRLVYEKAAFLPVGWHHRIRAKRSALIDPEGVLQLNAILAVHNVYLNE
jgi:ABC-type transport system substrate-binding protein